MVEFNIDSLEKAIDYLTTFNCNMDIKEYSWEDASAEAALDKAAWAVKEAQIKSQILTSQEGERLESLKKSRDIMQKEYEKKHARHLIKVAKANLIAVHDTHPDKYWHRQLSWHN